MLYTGMAVIDLSSYAADQQTHKQTLPNTRPCLYRVTHTRIHGHNIRARVGYYIRIY